jgi:hypothetical protein
MSSLDSPARDLGWKVTLAASFVPLLAGLSSMISAAISYADPELGYHTTLGRLAFTANEVGENPALGEYFRLVGSVGAVNVVAAAVYAMLVSVVGLRHRRRWAWFALLFSLVWVGLNDAAAATRFSLATGVPILVAPWTFVVLMTAGLGLSAATVFRRPPSDDGN